MATPQGEHAAGPGSLVGRFTARVRPTIPVELPRKPSACRSTPTQRSTICQATWVTSTQAGSGSPVRQIDNTHNCHLAVAENQGFHDHYQATMPGYSSLESAIPRMTSGSTSRRWSGQSVRARTFLPHARYIRLAARRADLVTCRRTTILFVLFCDMAPFRGIYY